LEYRYDGIANPIFPLPMVVRGHVF